MFTARYLPLLLLIFLFGCSSPPPAPIDGRVPPPSHRINEHYVSKGDTLFSIAWMYEKDLHKLAQANGLSRPYTIFEGQRLTLDTSNIRVATTSLPKKSPKPAKTTSAVTVKNSQKNQQADIKVTQKTTPLPASLGSKWSWQWPVPGSVTRRFNSGGLFKGVDLRVRPGQPVSAAAPGVIVYAGSGLRGYGKMIIVKHSEEFLSAYAHNRKLLVREGQVVKGGQKISEAGGDPANNRRLYFELRKDGKPVDPQQYLPKK